MIRTERATTSTLVTTLEDGCNTLICSPFFTKRGLQLIREEVRNAETACFLIRANIYDWARGYADLSELSEYVTYLLDNGTEVDLRIRANLHAKVYASKDQKRAYFGSANLTTAAFTSNLEVMTYADGDDSNQILQIIEEFLEQHFRIEVQDFLDIVELTSEEVSRVSGAIHSTDLDTDDNFNAVVNLFSEQLHDRKSRTIPRERSVRAISPDKTGNFTSLESGWPTIEDFIDYCSKDTSEDAQRLVARYLGQSNLQGHVKHMFYGCLFFFYENTSIIDAVPNDLLTREKVIWGQEPWVEDWINYLNGHSDEFYDNIGFNYHSLITYLPASLGGVQLTGGASSGNFKKVVFLLSRMLRENRQ